MSLLKALNIEPQWSEPLMAALSDLFARTDQAADGPLHAQLLQQYNVQQRQVEGISYHWLNLMLRSALRNGDFLSLTSWLYKTDKLIESQPDSFPTAFLLNYYEVSAVYHFYDNELHRAIREIEFVVLNGQISAETFERCYFYYLAILIAAYLPLKADRVLGDHHARIPHFQNGYLAAAFRCMVALDNHKDQEIVEELLADWQSYPHPNTISLAAQRSQAMIEAYLNRQTFQPTSVRLFPDNWEQILRIDLWLQAKLENKFYYNLIMEDWQSRKKVF
jgi:hypothetical protein